MPVKTEETNDGWSTMPNTSVDLDIPAAGSALLKETDGEDKVQPDFLELSESSPSLQRSYQPFEGHYMDVY